MIRLLPTSMSAVRGDAWTRFQTCRHAFGGRNRVFAFGPSLRPDSQGHICLDGLIVLLSGLCSPLAAEATVSRLLSNLPQQRWSRDSESQESLSFTRVVDDVSWVLTLICSEAPEATVTIHMVLTMGRIGEDQYRSLFAAASEQLSIVEQDGWWTYGHEGDANGLYESECDATPMTGRQCGLRELVALVRNRSVIGYTGAGVSQASGIPTFVGESSLEGKVPINESFPGLVGDLMIGHPNQLARTLGEFQASFLTARPNPAHFALSDLERMGVIQYLITTNFDDLHTEAGSQKVYRERDLFRSISPREWATLNRPGVLLVVGVSRDESHIVEGFREAGHEIVVLDISPPGLLREADRFVCGRAEAVLPLLAQHLQVRPGRDAQPRV